MITYMAYERAHLPGVVALCRAEGWPSFPGDPERAHRCLRAPGVTTVVALKGTEVIGFSCLQSDGEIQAHLSLIAVRSDHRRRGVGTELVAQALWRAGGRRIDLATDTAEEFFTALPHRRLAGFRLYPPRGAHPYGGTPPRPTIRHAGEGDRGWIAELLTRRWGSTTIVSRGRRHAAAELPAFLAESEGERCGLATYAIGHGEAELVTLDALHPGRGVGSALLAAVVAESTSAGCRRLWLVTSNDNLEAIRFYQRRGLRLVAVHAGALDEARRFKPQIPEVGSFGIPLHDELELALELEPGDRPEG